jgi:hypothetical protein
MRKFYLAPRVFNASRSASPISCAMANDLTRSLGSSAGHDSDLLASPCNRGNQRPFSTPDSWAGLHDGPYSAHRTYGREEFAALLCYGWFVDLWLYNHVKAERRLLPITRLPCFAI